METGGRRSTRKRDRYQSGFDGDIPGIRSATYDISLALYILEEIATAYGLLDERKTFAGGQSWTVAETLEIARAALSQSVSPVAWVYERLRQNEEAAHLLCSATSDSLWRDRWMALAETLSNRAIVSRGFISAARRELARVAQAERRAVDIAAAAKAAKVARTAEVARAANVDEASREIGGEVA